MKPLNKKQYLKQVIAEKKRQEKLKFFYRIRKSISIKKKKLSNELEKFISKYPEFLPLK